MAYGNYGAFVWKNGKLINNGTMTDTTYFYDKNKGWIWRDSLTEEEQEKYEEQKYQVGGHAVIPVDKHICLELYKTYGIKVHSGFKVKYYEYEEIKKHCKIKHSKDLEFSGYPIDNIESIWIYQISYKEDKYFVVIGSGVGAGYDTNHISKWFLKSVYFDKDRAGNYRYFYSYKQKDYYPTSEMIEYMIRRDDIDYENYWYKRDKWSLIKAIITLNFRDIIWYFNECREHHYKIKYLK